MAGSRPDAQGELAIRTPFGMLGYLDDPALTGGSFSEGYLRTGDLARLRPDGRVEIVGRLKDIISRGGNKIAPAEIDALLGSHPDVAAALCAGVPDPRLGEAIHAVVVPRANAALTPEALRRWASPSGSSDTRCRTRYIFATRCRSEAPARCGGPASPNWRSRSRRQNDNDTDPCNRPAAALSRTALRLLSFAEATDGTARKRANVLPARSPSGLRRGNAQGLGAAFFGPQPAQERPAALLSRFNHS